ncbi:MAG: histidine kinase N-terminal 7TM domain-containing protein [Anaerolineales bacterium]|jgi:hypothetical protein
MAETVLATLLVLNQILNAGNAITAFSLLLYALTFNLRERIARVFALLLASVTIVYFCDVLTGTGAKGGEQELWLRLQWLGIALMPAIYLHLSEVLIESTGRASHRLMRVMIGVGYLLGGGTFAAVMFLHSLAGELTYAGVAAYLKPGPLFVVYLLFFLACLSFAGLNYWRAYRRCLTSTSKRRMVYLMAGSVGPVLGCFPFLMSMGGGLGGNLPHLFWGSLVVINVMVTVLLVVMAYAVAYYGVSHPDRVVKSRLFQWILRGPVVASTVLATTMVVERLSTLVGVDSSRAMLFAMVGMLLLLQFLITLIRPPLERWIFYGTDRQDIIRLHLLEDRLLTTSDLRQFLESIVNAVCDITGAPSAFVAVVGPEGLDLEVAVGPDDPLRGAKELPPLLENGPRRTYSKLGTVFSWDVYWLIPLKLPEGTETVGLLGVRARGPKDKFDAEEEEALGLLAERAAGALSDRLLQREVFHVVDSLTPQVEAVQRMRAAARYGGADALTMPLQGVHSEADLATMVRDALGHYWGGPNLTHSPLLRFRVVREALEKHDGNPVNALRAILRRGIEKVKPEGERRFTAEWMLYNILEMKFLEGRKVRDIAMRLAMSEADLYRKQRVAIEAVAHAMADMERQAAIRAAERDGSNT